MPKYKIAATWRVGGDFVIEADTLEAAIEVAYSGEQGTDTLKGKGEYLDDTFEVQLEDCEKLSC